MIAFFFMIGEIVSLDFASTKLIARQGYANFIENNFNVGEHIEDSETPESSDVE